MSKHSAYDLILAIAFTLIAVFIMVVIFTGCSEDRTYVTATDPCCSDTCNQVHTCDQATGCTDECSDKYENVWICYKGETKKVPLSEKKEWTDKGATIGKCKGTPGDDDDDDTPGDDDDDDSNDKVCICHFPPGNPDNFHTICIGAAAVPAHIRNHGDLIGRCEDLDFGRFPAG